MSSIFTWEYCFYYENDTASIFFWWGVVDIWWKVASKLNQWEFSVTGRMGNFEQIWYMQSGCSHIFSISPSLPCHFYTRCRPSFGILHAWVPKDTHVWLFCSLMTSSLNLHNTKTSTFLKWKKDIPKRIMPFLTILRGLSNTQQFFFMLYIYTLTLEVPEVINFKLLLAISVLHQENSLWQIIKRSPKDTCCDLKNKFAQLRTREFICWYWSLNK